MKTFFYNWSVPGIFFSFVLVVFFAKAAPVKKPALWTDQLTIAEMMAIEPACEPYEIIYWSGTPRNLREHAFLKVRSAYSFNITYTLYVNGKRIWRDAHGKLRSRDAVPGRVCAELTKHLKEKVDE